MLLTDVNSQVGGWLSQKLTSTRTRHKSALVPTLTGDEGMGVRTRLRAWLRTACRFVAAPSQRQSANAASGESRSLTEQGDFERA